MMKDLLLDNRLEILALSVLGYFISHLISLALLFATPKDPRAWVNIVLYFNATLAMILQEACGLLSAGDANSLYAASAMGMFVLLLWVSDFGRQLIGVRSSSRTIFTACVAGGMFSLATLAVLSSMVGHVIWTP